MGKVYFPRTGVERIRANGYLITDKGVGFVSEMPKLDNLVVSTVLRCVRCNHITTDGQEMGVSYEDALHNNFPNKEICREPEKENSDKNSESVSNEEKEEEGSEIDSEDEGIEEAPTVEVKEEVKEEAPAKPRKRRRRSI